MPADDGGDSGGGWVEVERGKIVEHIEAVPGEFDEFGGWKLGAGAGAVDVSADGGDGREGAERVENLNVANIAGVEDVIDAAQGSDGFRTQKAMRV